MGTDSGARRMGLEWRKGDQGATRRRLLEWFR